MRFFPWPACPISIMEEERRRFRALLKGEFEPYLHAGDLPLIVAEALRALGLKPEYLFHLLAVPNERRENFFDPSVLGSDEWLAICDVLYLSPDCYSYGYARREHRARIRVAIEIGYFHLSQNPCVRQLRREIRRDRRTEFRYQSKNYGFRLRWKIRWQDFNSWRRRRRVSGLLIDNVTARAQIIAARRLGDEAALPGLTRNPELPTNLSQEMNPLQ